MSAHQHRHLYTHDQISQYFDRICLPSNQRIFNIRTDLSTDTERLAFLTLLTKHHLVKVPWENLSQHYSWHRNVDVRPATLIRKIVHSPSGGRGGYCMEANFFFHLILFALGFDVHMVGSRICHDHSPEGKFDDHYGGWTHVVNIVTLFSPAEGEAEANGNESRGKRYMLDGGFGPQGPTAPLLLDTDNVSGVEQIAPARMRAVYAAIPEFLDRRQRVWIYQFQYDETSPWRPMYCFTETEFTPADISSMNFEPALNPRTFFTHKVVAVRFSAAGERVPALTPEGEFLDSNDNHDQKNEGKEAVEGEIDGSITLDNDILKWRRKGKVVVRIALKTEEYRVECWKRFFGIHLAPEEVEAIAHTSAALDARRFGIE